jgi:hypothetical protein
MKMQEMRALYSQKIHGFELQNMDFLFAEIISQVVFVIVEVRDVF